MRLSYQIIAHFYVSLSSLVQSTSLLGEQPEKRNLIAGGTEYGGPLDYAVVIQHDGSFVCGGALIADNVVLTAAECKASSIDSYEIVVGVYDRTQVPPVTKSVVKELIHPDYDFFYQYNDIMLLKLNETVIGYNSIEMNADPRVPMENDVVNFTGWGSTEDRGDFSSVLQTVDVVYITNDQCNLQLSSYGYESVNEWDMCTFKFFAGACEGDHGGPLILDRQGVPLLVGISSRALECGGFLFPTFSMRVSSFVDWIQYSMCFDLSDSEEYLFCGDLARYPVTTAPTVSFSEVPRTTSNPASTPTTSPITTPVATFSTAPFFSSIPPMVSSVPVYLAPNRISDSSTCTNIFSLTASMLSLAIISTILF